LFVVAYAIVKITTAGTTSGEKEIIFSPKDVLMKMIEKNPDIKNLYDTFDLEIA
jgi:hypothetical protein